MQVYNYILQNTLRVCCGAKGTMSLRYYPVRRDCEGKKEGLRRKRKKEGWEGHNEVTGYCVAPSYYEEQYSQISCSSSPPPVLVDTCLSGSIVN